MQQLLRTLSWRVSHHWGYLDQELVALRLSWRGYYLDQEASHQVQEEPVVWTA